MRFLAMLLFAFSVAAQVGEHPLGAGWIKGNVTIIQVGNDDTYAVAVRTTNKEAEEAIVTIMYWTDVPGMYSPLLRSKVSVVPVFDGVMTISDSAPVPASKVKSVEVKLVKKVETQRFETGLMPDAGIWAPMFKHDK